MNDFLHASGLPGTVAWVAERLGYVGQDGAVSVAQLSSLTVGQIASIPFMDTDQVRDFVADLSHVLGTNGGSFTSVPLDTPVSATPLPVAAKRAGRPRQRTAQQVAPKGRAGTKTRTRSELTGRIADHLATHPGSIMSEIAEALGATEHEVAIAARPVDWLILDPSELVAPAERVESDAIKATRERARAAMQAASLITSPVSHQAYTTLVREGRIKGPSVARIVQLFGSWTAACAEVGVSSGEPLRKNYQRNWTNEDLIGYIQRFLAEPRYRGASHQYDKWRATVSKREKVPSLGTVRNLLGGTWNEIRAEALRGMRATWATPVKRRVAS